jgi:rhodanese-related sulfurtransferase
MNEVNNISATEAYKILEQDADAILIDVRTIPEWSFVGLQNKINYYL